MTTSNGCSWVVCRGPARTWEVSTRHSSEEADEQSRATGCGAGGAKGGGRGECRPAKHVPGTEPGKRVTGAGTHTARHPATDGARVFHPSSVDWRQGPQGKSRVPELGPLGSVRGALSNEWPYRDLSCAK